MGGETPTWRRCTTAIVISAVVGVCAPSAAFADNESAEAGRPGPMRSCSGLAETTKRQRDVLAATSAVVPATASSPSYCSVDLTEKPAIRIRVGLPLNGVDRGSGGSVNGAWNGKVQNMGGGGYAGSLSDLSWPLGDGYVGSTTDTGHSAEWCNAVNPWTRRPNSQPDCGLAGGGFVLDSQNRLLEWQVKDFITDSLLAQTLRALRLTSAYYGSSARRNYWTGASTGGRQGFEMAQKYGYLFDGFLVGAPAFNWNRFIAGEAWPAIVVKDLLGPGGLALAKSAAANSAAISACDANDGAVDGVINEPRRCSFDARSLVCAGGANNPANCLTATEARVINLIWDGPRTPRGGRLWGGIQKGTSFDTLLLGPSEPSPLILTYLQNWMFEDPTFNWRTLSLKDFESLFAWSYGKFAQAAATDDIRLDAVRRAGAKIFTWHGLSDPLIVPFGSFNYTQRVFDRYGVQNTQSFMRSFFFPGVDHVVGGAAPQPDMERMFDALQEWVERGVTPDHLVAAQQLSNGGVRTRKVCMYPNEAIYDGSGSTDDESNWQCAVHPAVPGDLAADARTILER